MFVSGGKILAIDHVNVDNKTIFGDGVAQPLRINEDFIANSVYFNATSGTNYSNDYFSWHGDTLSVSDKVKYFNLSFNYAVTLVAPCPDFVYQTQLTVDNTPIVDKHCIDGSNTTNTYNVSVNLSTNDNKNYKFTYSADNARLDNLYVSCIGFVNSANIEPPVPTTSINVLSDEQDRMIVFDNDGQNIVL